jgi:hypothetical protein
MMLSPLLAPDTRGRDGSFEHQTRAKEGDLTVTELIQEPTMLDHIARENIADDRPRRTTLSRELVITGDRAEALWEMYRETFASLRELAIQQHLWSREEIMGELANKEIVKFVGWNDGVPVGLCMLTNNLDLVPMISPQFLNHRFPAYAARNAIYYGIMIFVRAGFRGRTLFARLTAQMGRETARNRGVVVFDMCSFNREHSSLDQSLARMARPAKNSSMAMIDQQTWFAIELPEPVELEPSRDSGAIGRAFEPLPRSPVPTG